MTKPLTIPSMPNEHRFTAMIEDLRAWGTLGWQTAQELSAKLDASERLVWQTVDERDAALQRCEDDAAEIKRLEHDLSSSTNELNVALQRVAELEPEVGDDTIHVP